MNAKNRSPRVRKPKPREVGVLDALAQAFAELKVLGAEHREWANNMKAYFEGTTKYQAVLDAAENLEELVNPAGAEYAPLNEMKVTVQDPTPRRRPYSRGCRFYFASEIVHNVLDQLDEKRAGPIEDPLHDLSSALLDEFSSVQKDLDDIVIP